MTYYSTAPPPPSGRDGSLENIKAKFVKLYSAKLARGTIEIQNQYTLKN
jgi:hypothetical protein